MMFVNVDALKAQLVKDNRGREIHVVEVSRVEPSSEEMLSESPSLFRKVREWIDGNECEAVFAELSWELRR